MEIVEEENRNPILATLQLLNDGVKEEEKKDLSHVDSLNGDKPEEEKGDTTFPYILTTDFIGGNDKDFNNFDEKWICPRNVPLEMMMDNDHKTLEKSLLNTQSKSFIKKKSDFTQINLGEGSIDVRNDNNVYPKTDREISFQDNKPLQDENESNEQFVPSPYLKREMKYILEENFGRASDFNVSPNKKRPK